MWLSHTKHNENRTLIAKHTKNVIKPFSFKKTYPYRGIKLQKLKWPEIWNTTQTFNFKNRELCFTRIKSTGTTLWTPSGITKHWQCEKKQISSTHLHLKPACGMWVGTRWSLRPLPIQDILWFNDLCFISNTASNVLQQLISVYSQLWHKLKKDLYSPK